LKLQASRCYELSCQIINSIEATKLQKSKSTAKVILAAFKSRASEGERDVLQQQLRECRQQLNVQMTFVSRFVNITSAHEPHSHLFRSEFRTRLSTLAKKNDAELKILDNLQHHIHSLQECTTVHSIGNQAVQQLKDILSLPCAAREAMALQSILKVLHYDRMRDRYDVVQPAHHSTFRWVLEEDSAQTKQGAKARNLFMTWLAQGGEFFHIAGKPGSGKSTLMKFLYSHQRTRTELEHWASTFSVDLRST
jgi:Cdc6-like AAA superfamily ATPase